MTSSEAILLDETPIRCGMPPDAPSLTKEDLMKRVMLFTQEHFPCVNIFTPEGVSKEELLHGVRCISMAIRHDTAEKYVDGKNIFFVCANNKECPFTLHFKKFNEKWRFTCDDERNTVSSTCSVRFWPRICTSKNFMQFFIKVWLENSDQSLEDVKTAVVHKMLAKKGLQGSHTRTIQRALSALRKKSEESILESDQKVEDYLQALNQCNQYGVLLYSNCELVVPGVGEGLHEGRFCPAFCYTTPYDTPHFWDRQPVIDPAPCGKRLLMTFEAVSAAVKAFQYSFPVICLDACTVKCPNTRVVLLSATFETTDGHLLTMCFGTAPNESIESWSFFLANLRQVLCRYCKIDNWGDIVFMSDRNKGIIRGVQTHFPQSAHLFCVVHLLRNLNSNGKMKVSYFWRAVEATNEREFDFACSQLPRSSKLNSIMVLASHWSRFAIRECGIRRYGVRTNNWSESQNNALKNERTGPVLDVLFKSFLYTTNKVVVFRERARLLKKEGGCNITPFAKRIYKSNYCYSQRCTKVLRVGDFWQVWEADNSSYAVVIRDRDNVDCSCHRYFDEGIPCSHIIRVMGTHYFPFSVNSLISPIYYLSRFCEAFPDELPFFPCELGLYSKNLSVVPQVLDKRLGAPQTRRFASTGEFFSGNCRTHRVSQAKFRPKDPSNSAMDAITIDGAVKDPRMSSSFSEDEDLKKIEVDLSLASNRNVNGELLNSIMKFIDELDDTQFQVSEGDLPTRDDISLKVNRGSQPVISVDDDEEVENGDTDAASCKKQRHDSDHSSTPSAAAVAAEKNITSIPVSQQVSEVNRTLTEAPKSDSIPSAPAPIQTVGLRQDHNGMMTLPKSAIVARGPSYLAMKRMSWSPANDKKGTEANKTKRSAKKLKLLVPEKYLDLLKHDEAIYCRWEQYYDCFYHSTMLDIFLSGNKKPSFSQPALIPLIPNVSITYDELKQMSDTTDWKEGELVPVFSKELITKFLARVHAFTAVGLEAQATAFSDGADGIINCLALLPQINRVGSVSSRDDGPTEFDAIQRFCEMDPHDGSRLFCARCWIHTHPRFKAFMSSTDICQLYGCACQNRSSFGIVLSPRRDGLKMLCVHLTREGFEEVKRFYMEASCLHVNVTEYVKQHIHDSETKFYCQIPFIISDQPCHVVDLRSSEEVVHQLGTFIRSGEADVCWVSK